MKTNENNAFNELQNHNIPEDLLLFLILNNHQYVASKMCHYKLYGKTCERLFKLCNYDYSLFVDSISVIDASKISIDIVHINLNFDDPIPFINNPIENKDYEELYWVGIDFLKKYEKKFNEILDQNQMLFSK